MQKAIDETYATTLAVQVFRTTMAISAVYSYEIRQYDIVAAYINADLPVRVSNHNIYSTI